MVVDVVRMAKIVREKEVCDGWSRWVAPVMDGYKMCCCDCGLVHEMDFVVVRVLEKREDGSWEHGDALDSGEYRVLFRAKRDNRSTGQVRRHGPRR